MIKVFYSKIKKTDTATLPKALHAHVLTKTNEKSRTQSAFAYSMLCILFPKVFAKPLPNVSFDNRGKPYFEDCDCHLSLSHSADLAALCLSDTEVGIDVQRVGELSANSAAVRLLPNLESTDYTDSRLALEWVKKECAAKLYGGGIGYMLANRAIPETCLFDSIVADFDGDSYVIGCAHSSPKEIIEFLPVSF